MTRKETQLSRNIYLTKNVKQRNLNKLHTPVPKRSPPKEQLLQQLFPWDGKYTHKEDPELVVAFVK